MVRSSTRVYSFDLLRILAICAVVMIHVSADFIKEFHNNTMDFICGNVLNNLSRFAVPVFFMISGALMLDETKDISVTKIRKSTLSLLVLTFSWSFIYTLAYNVVRPLIFSEPLVIPDILDTLFNGHYHMWYLYALIGLYFISPVLRLFIKKENATLIRNYLLVSIGVCFFASFLNEILNIYTSCENVISDFLGNFQLNYIYDSIIYFVLGWYVANVGLDKTIRRVLYILGILSLFAGCIFTQFYFSPSKEFYFLKNSSLNVFLYSLAVFVFVYYAFENKKITLNHFWVKLSKFTFGVYIVHCMYLFILKIIFGRLENSLIEIFSTFSGCIVLSFVTVFVISKIPMLKKLIRE